MWFLSDAEYGRLGRVLAAAQAAGVPNPVAVGAIRLLLLTGLRPGELLALRWDQVDLAEGALRLAAAGGGVRRVPLGAAALAVLAALPRRAGAPHLFPGRGREGRLSDLQPVWARIRAAAGLADVRLLDLRHSFASRAAVTGDSLTAVGRLLDARDSQTLGRYPHAGEAALKAAAERLSGELERLMGRVPMAPSARSEAADGPAAGALDAVARTRWLDAAAAAQRAGLARATLAAYRRQGTGPPFRRFGGRVMYPEAPLEAWIAAQAAAPRMGRPPDALRRIPHFE